MRKFEFYKIEFDKLKEGMYVALEELYFEYNFVLNAYCLFKDSNGEDCQLIIPFRRAVTEKKISDMEVLQQKRVIKNTSINYFGKKYGTGFDKKINSPTVIYLEDKSQFTPSGFKDLTYDEICETMHSEDLVDLFQKMKGDRT